MTDFLNAEIGNPAILIFVVLMVGGLSVAGFVGFSKLKTLISNNQRSSEICFKVLGKTQEQIAGNQKQMDDNNVSFFRAVEETGEKLMEGKIQKYKRKLNFKWKKARAENRLG